MVSVSYTERVKNLTNERLVKKLKIIFLRNFRVLLNKIFGGKNSNLTAYTAILHGYIKVQ